MMINDSAIYGTEAMDPYKYENICITSKPNGAVYLVYLVQEGQKELPSEIYFEGYVPEKNVKASLLGHQTKIRWNKDEDGIRIKIPENLKPKLLQTEAFTFRLK